MLNELHLKKSWLIINRTNLNTSKIKLIVIGYYLLSVISTLLDGASLILLTDLVFSQGGKAKEVLAETVSLFGSPAINIGYLSMYLIVIALFLTRGILIYLTTNIQGYLTVKIRRQIQEYGYRSILSGSWEFLREIKIGERVGALTEEAGTVASYFITLIISLYSLVSAVILLVMALLVSYEMTLILGLLGVPVLLILNNLFREKAIVGQNFVEQRQSFYARIAEDLNGLMQIKVSGAMGTQLDKLTIMQNRLFTLEFKTHRIRAVIDIINFVIPAVVLIVLQVWAIYKDLPLAQVLPLFAQVGVIGTRVRAQLNNLISYIGSLTAYAGSIPPVYKLFEIPSEPVKEVVNEKINSVEIRDVSYWYSEQIGFSGVSIEAAVGKPLLIRGPSGSGKTSLANLIAGLFEPLSGTVLYKGVSGKTYGSRQYRPRVGYVTQDIFLFQGTVRDNLTLNPSPMNNEQIWEHLKSAGADDFVRNLGGLESEIVEGGRSLSGGEKRRLGIARVLTNNPDILILDEVTVGLDPLRRQEILKTIEHLAAKLVVILITHEDLEITNQVVWNFNK